VTCHHKIVLPVLLHQLHALRCTMCTVAHAHGLSQKVAQCCLLPCIAVHTRKCSIR
jgi:hypothetical protein